MWSLRNTRKKVTISGCSNLSSAARRELVMVSYISTGVTGQQVSSASTSYLMVTRSKNIDEKEHKEFWDNVYVFLSHDRHYNVTVLLVGKRTVGVDSRSTVPAWDPLSDSRVSFDEGLIRDRRSHTAALECMSVLKSRTVSPQVSAWTNCPTLQKSDVSHPRRTRRGPTVLQSSWSVCRLVFRRFYSFY
ncbi:hypothetical protein J6590_016453 [Homalodisca vitripennis]|nr:hypothetical protein J6590_016453 [Homalodisca vitripennis]